MGDTIKTISCDNDVIVPEVVIYGGTSQGTSCVSTKAWFRLADLCFKKTTCSLSVNGMINSQYPDPCPGENKQLKVQYSCVRSK